MVLAQRARIVEADEHAACQIGRKADEPDILGIVRRAGLAGQRLADRLDRQAGAALHDAFQQRDDLIGGARIDDLCARIGQQRLGLVVPGGALQPSQSRGSWR